MVSGWVDLIVCDAAVFVFTSSIQWVCVYFLHVNIQFTGTSLSCYMQHFVCVKLLYVTYCIAIMIYSMLNAVVCVCVACRERGRQAIKATQKHSRRFSESFCGRSLGRD